MDNAIRMSEPKLTERQREFITYMHRHSVVVKWVSVFRVGRFHHHTVRWAENAGYIECPLAPERFLKFGEGCNDWWYAQLTPSGRELAERIRQEKIDD